MDLRISTLPSTYGERVVLRLLDPSRSPHLLNFAALGMPPEVERRYLAQVSRTSGIVLSTGPTGSGKTTTLYATLAWMSETNAGGQARGVGGCELNMMTVEDPVEYDLSTGGRAGLSVSQTQVDAKKGVTFVTGLKHILRQDPDVIMVGEVRDEETARIAVQASLTGHLVFSTLHTNDAASAVARLLDLGVEPFLVSPALSAVLAQRLVRTRHAACGSRCAECVAPASRAARASSNSSCSTPPSARWSAAGPRPWTSRPRRSVGMVTLRDRRAPRRHGRHDPRGSGPRHRRSRRGGDMTRDARSPAHGGPGPRPASHRRSRRSGVACAFWPLGPSRLGVPEIGVAAEAPAEPASPVLDVAAFNAPLWVAPPTQPRRPGRASWQRPRPRRR